MRISDWSSNVCSSDLQHPLYFATLSRFEAHQPETVAPGSSERAVMDAGAAVHEVTIAALRVGMRDGSIRRTRQPMLLAMTLWSFTHGAIQVAQTKGAFLDEAGLRSEEHTSELQSLMRISYAVFCLKKKTNIHPNDNLPLPQSHTEARLTSH